jgi:hypothetical protein
MIKEKTMNVNEQKRVAGTILEQLGGRKFMTMVGAHNLVCSDEGCGTMMLKFKGSKVANFLKITLTAMDLYDVEFGKIWGHRYTVVKTAKGYYNDMLVRLFEETTGLYTKLF